MTFGPRLRVKRSALQLPPPADAACLLSQHIPAPVSTPVVVGKRRGRAPAHIPDPWADLEWDVHPEAKEAVSRHPAGMTLEEIGAQMGITRERVRQIENSALKKLRDNTGGDISWLGKLTIATPDCKRCGDPFVRRKGRQVFCDTCEATRRRKRPAPTQIAPSALCA